MNKKLQSIKHDYKQLQKHLRQLGVKNLPEVVLAATDPAIPFPLRPNLSPILRQHLAKSVSNTGVLINLLQDSNKEILELLTKDALITDLNKNIESLNKSVKKYKDVATIRSEQLDEMRLTILNYKKLLQEKDERIANLHDELEAATSLVDEEEETCIEITLEVSFKGFNCGEGCSCDDETDECCGNCCGCDCEDEADECCSDCCGCDCEDEADECCSDCCGCDCGSEDDDECCGNLGIPSGIGIIGIGIGSIANGLYGGHTDEEDCHCKCCEDSEDGEECGNCCGCGYNAEHDTCEGGVTCECPPEIEGNCACVITMTLSDLINEEFPCGIDPEDKVILSVTWVDGEHITFLGDGVELVDGHTLIITLDNGDVVIPMDKVKYYTVN